MEQDPVRLQKIIAEAGLSSRRGAERLIANGKVKVNGIVVSNLGAKAVPGVDEISVSGKVIGTKEPTYYYMFHKPSGVLTALKDEQLNRPTIFSYIKELPVRVYPVGRLDRDVSGFLVLTNDGELASRLMHPSYRVPKVYRAKVNGIPDKNDLEMLQSGSLIIKGKPAAPAEAGIITKGPDKGFIELILTEGRHRQVKRMLKAIGHPVILLKRIAYSGIPLDPNLPPGSVRKLTAAEIQILKDRVLL
jgi:23S rRNA pseudouridine2605 synthase